MISSPVQTKRPQFKSGYLPTLDGWRAIAIAAVLLDHATTGFHQRASWYPLFRTGADGVSLFFAISGFLICSRLLEEEQLCGRISLTPSAPVQKRIPAGSLVKPGSRIRAARRR